MCYIIEKIILTKIHTHVVILVTKDAHVVILVTNKYWCTDIIYKRRNNLLIFTDIIVKSCTNIIWERNA